MNYIKKFENFSVGSPWDDIIVKLEESQSYGWYGDELEETIQCVTLENGWLEDLNELEMGNVPEILSKIEENRFDLWEDDMGDTFECILTEDLYDGGELVSKYNGWYEDLINLSKDD